MNGQKPFLYQTDFSKAHPELYDFAAREIKAKKILAVLADHFGYEALRGMIALDVGCSSGLITSWLSGYFAMTYGVDIDSEAIAFANRRFASERLHFQTGDGLRMDFPDSSFDLIVCSQVYEHVPDCRLLMAEIHRLLRIGGVCYFSAGNRLRLIEPHYHLPLLSVVPKPIAHSYLRLIGRGDHYYENHLSLWGLRRLTSAFRVIDYTERVLRSPKKFHLEDSLREGGILHCLVPIAMRTLYFACPNYIWLLEKTRRST
jgi:2-polyprenyl-3-methyl-5-hydroxy-6-metoxy-1,4-benzoquinol methylase